MVSVDGVPYLVEASVGRIVMEFGEPVDGDVEVSKAFIYNPNAVDYDELTLDEDMEDKLKQAVFEHVAANLPED